MFLYAVWMAGWLGWLDPVSDCPDTIPEAWEIAWDDSKAAAIDSCAEPLSSRRAYGRASLALSRTSENSTRTVFRHSATVQGWKSKVEFRNDTLWRRQVGWESGGWKLSAGDMTDTAMPLLSRWLPRRTFPSGWTSAPGEYLPPSPALQGVGAGVFRPGWKAYALQSLNPLRTGREPPWMDPWEFRHGAAGAEAAIPWPVSLHLSETRIVRSGSDSVAEYRMDAGLASPSARLRLNGAWVDGAKSGGFAFGIGMRQPFGETGGVEFNVRQRSAGWGTVWDPAWAASDPDRDTGWGTGDFDVSLRLPIATEAGQAHVEGKGWQAWNPALETRRAGVRGEASYRGTGVSILTRAAHGQYSGGNGVTYNRQFSLRVSAGKNPEWSAKVWNVRTEQSGRRGMGLEVEGRVRGFKIRPGAEMTGVDGLQPQVGFSLWSRLSLGSGWALEGRGEAPDGDFSGEAVRFNLALHFQGKSGH